MLVDFYKARKRAPLRTHGDDGDQDGAYEHRLYEMLRSIRRKVCRGLPFTERHPLLYYFSHAFISSQEASGACTPQVLYLRRHAPELLRQRPQDFKLLESANKCVAWVQAGRPKADPEAARFAEFLKTRKRDLSRGTRDGDDVVIIILREGIPGWPNATQGMKGLLWGSHALYRV
jgi:hypothetical protein